MAYDNEPVVSVEEKRVLLGEAADRGWALVSEHDRAAPRATVRAASDGTFETRTFATDDDR
jgi:hypothetical protein